MKIGYYVQGAADEAFVWGLAARWCPQAELEMGKFRGTAKESFRREIKKSLNDLANIKGCDVLIVLTDSDVNDWHDVKRREWQRIPPEHQPFCVLGVADRNIESWLALDIVALAVEIGRSPKDLAVDDPKGNIDRGFELGEFDGPRRDEAKLRVKKFVASAPLRVWIESNSNPSFAAFYDDIRALAAQRGCALPNERDAR